MMFRIELLLVLSLLFCLNLNSVHAQDLNLSISTISELDESAEDVPLMGHLVSALFDEDKNLYLLDEGNKKVHVFNQNAEFLRSFGGEGRGPGEFLRPVSTLALDNSSNLIYVADYQNGRILGFNTQTGENEQTIILQSTSMIPVNKLIFFEGNLYLLGSHQRSNRMIHRIDIESGETVFSTGNFIDFDSFTYNSNGKMQLSIVHASSLGEDLMVGLAAPKRMKVFNRSMEKKRELEDSLLPTPWETHMVMRPDEYSSTFYSNSMSNQILSDDHYLYKWAEVLNPEGPEIVYHLDLRCMNTGEKLYRKSLDREFVVGMHRESDREAILFMRDDDYNYSIRKLEIGVN